MPLVSARIGFVMVKYAISADMIDSTTAIVARPITVMLTFCDVSIACWR